MNTIQPLEEQANAALTRLYEVSKRWEAACSSGFAAALWRLPNQRVTELLIDTSGRVQTAAMDLEELPAGFAVSPFLNPDNEQALFLNADLYWRFAESGLPEAEVMRCPSDHPAVRRFQAAVAQGSSRPVAPVTAEAVEDLPAAARFEQMVEKAIRAMRRDAFRKVVLSRTKTVTFSGVPDVVALFDRLCHAYPTAFVSAVYLPDRQQIWIGATPERLVSQDASGLFRTVALAGTQSALDPEGQPKRTSDAQWTQKEIEEQALVCRYIISCFKKIRLREYVEEGPRTVTAGNLMHLRTDYSVRTHEVNFPQLATVMLRLLHPTSAVCGMPKEPATHFILDEEGYDRELYSGYLGPVNLSSTEAGPETHLFVNLRCMKLENGIGTLYAGAGITEDSVPAREWRETELKCRTMLDVVAGK